MLFLPYVQILKLKFQFGSLVKTSYLGSCGRRISERKSSRPTWEGNIARSLPQKQTGKLTFKVRALF